MIVFLDCDSTLSSIEAVDELARLRGAEVAAEVVKLTDKAMDGELPIHEVFGARLDLIRPSMAECLAMGEEYIQTVEPTAKESVAKLQAAGWEVVIVSGGHTQVIQPLADFLGIERIEAVDLYFDEKGNYTDYERDYPSTRNGGKPEIIASVKAERETKSPSVMIGDGVSDLEAKGEVDLFIGFCGYLERERVVSEADVLAHTLSEAVDLLLERYA